MILNFPPVLTEESDFTFSCTNFFSLSFRFQFFISKTLTLTYCIAWKLSGSFSLQIKDKLCLAVTFLKCRTWARSYTPCLLLFFELQPWLAWDISLKKSEKVPPTAKSTDINKRFLVACLLPWRVFFFLAFCHHISHLSRELFCVSRIINKFWKKNGEIFFVTCLLPWS